MKLKPGAILPNLITLGNGICGFAAVVKLMKVEVVTEGERLAFADPGLFTMAAWLILLGMVFDVFDGQVARLSKHTSDLGAQLDSLCDLITFGLAPALLVVRFNMIYDPAWQNVVWFLCLAYFAGAVLRLARFNIENEPDASAHLAFKGLPTPAAAGCVASLAIFQGYLSGFEQGDLKWLSGYVAPESLRSAAEWIPYILPVLALVLGWTMVSDRLKFDHVATQLFHRSQSFNVFVLLIFGVILACIFPEVVLLFVFIGYLFFTPTRLLLDWLSDSRSRRSRLATPTEGDDAS